MITYAQAIAATKDAVCPYCLHEELSAEFHLDWGSECFCTARCGHCGRRFALEFIRFRTLAEMQQQVETGLAASPCPVCGQVDYRLSLLCERTSQDCYFQACCRECGTIYRVEVRPGRVALVRPGV